MAGHFSADVPSRFLQVLLVLLGSVKAEKGGHLAPDSAAAPIINVVQ